jgi:hypothetical protein
MDQNDRDSRGAPSLNGQAAQKRDIAGDGVRDGFDSPYHSAPNGEAATRSSRRRTYKFRFPTAERFGTVLAMIPLLSDFSAASKRIRRNNSGKHYGKIPSISR